MQKSNWFALLLGIMIWASLCIALDYCLVWKDVNGLFSTVPILHRRREKNAMGNFSNKTINKENENGSADFNAANQKLANKTFAEVKIRQEKRQTVLRKACANLQMKQALPKDDEELMKLIGNSRLYFSDKHKFLACEIPKVGCTNFKKVLLTVEGLTKERNPKSVIGAVAHDVANNLLLLGNLKNITEIRHRLKTYYKFVTVREPLHRLLSAYRNKFEKTHVGYFKKISEKIHNIYKAGNDEKGSQATFPEFLQYLLDPSVPRDRHWEFYYKLCHPCTINYNFIAHLETVEQDMAYFMNEVGIKNISFPSKYSTSLQTNEDRVNAYYADIPELSKHIYNFYKVDYDIFGYPPPEF